MCRIWVLFACFVGVFFPSMTRRGPRLLNHVSVKSVSHAPSSIDVHSTFMLRLFFFFFFFLVSGHICVYRTAVRGCMRVDMQRINARLGWYSALVRQRGAGRKCSPRFFLDHAHFLPRSPCDHVACFGKYGEVDGGEKRRQQQWCAQPQTPTTPVGRVLWLGRVSHTRRTCSAASWSGERGWWGWVRPLGGNARSLSHTLTHIHTLVDHACFHGPARALCHRLSWEVRDIHRALWLFLLQGCDLRFLPASPR